MRVSLEVERDLRPAHAAAVVVDRGEEHAFGRRLRGREAGGAHGHLAPHRVVEEAEILAYTARGEVIVDPESSFSIWPPGPTALGSSSWLERPWIAELLQA
jgi:hypothetical protein